jgi:hypothetical protein
METIDLSKKETRTKLLKKFDIQEEEIQYWERMVKMDEVDQFCLDHKVKIEFKDGAYNCWIDDKLYASQFTSFGALYRGIHEYKRGNK